MRPYFGNRMITLKDHEGPPTAGPALQSSVQGRLSVDQKQLFQDAQKVLYRAPCTIVFVSNGKETPQRLER